jgi:hypothetical protein
MGPLAPAGYTNPATATEYARDFTQLLDPA